jgi:GTP:adenosylcobinamide-phosphate guanylyltransferase
MALKLIITAGGALPRDMQGPGQPPNKALLALGGETLLDRAVAAGRALPGSGGVVVVGDASVRTALPPGAEYAAAGGSVIDNLVRGFEHHGGPEHDYVVLSSDLPFVTPAALERFASQAQNTAQMALPVVSRGAFLARFPGAPNKFERIDGRELTMGSAFYCEGRLLQQNIPLMQDFAKHRKAPVKLAILLGWSVLWGFLTRHITLAALERRASALTGGKVQAVETDAAELAYDVDTLAEYEFARRLLTTAPR